MKKKGQAEDKLGLVLHIIGAALSVPILVLCTVRGAIEYGAAGVLTGLAFSVSMLILSHSTSRHIIGMIIMLK